MTLPDLCRRLSRKIDSGKGAQLSAADLNLFVASGAWRALSEARLRFEEQQCQSRAVQSHSISERDSSSTLALVASGSKSSGTIPSESVNEALARVLAITGRDA